MSAPTDKIGSMFDTVSAPPDLTARLKQLAALPPSGALLTELQDLAVGAVDQRSRLLVLQCLERADAWLSARRTQLVARIAGALPVRVDAQQTSDDFVREELAGVARIGLRSAGRRIDFARTVAWLLPASLCAWQQAEITYGQLIALYEATIGLDEPNAHALEARALQFAELPPAAFRRKVRRLALSVNPQLTNAQHAQTLAERRVVMYPDGPGTASVLAEHLPADHAEMVFSTLTLLTEQLPADDPRSKDQQRADLFCELFAERLTDPTLPTPHRRRLEAQVVIPFDTLLGLSDEPGMLAGYGPIPAPLARRLAGDASWRRLITDPVSGHLLDYGTTTYTPPQQLVDYLLARDRRCQFPNCSHPARYCHIDHRTSARDGGPTSAENCWCLCERHHHLKHHPDWQVTNNSDCTITWTSPNGFTFRSPPPPQLE